MSNHNELFKSFLVISALSLSFSLIIAVKLGKYDIDANKVTVSGVSSGGAMAAQLHVAFSSRIIGSGIVAGPPYFCSNGVLTTATTTCMGGLLTTINVNNLVSTVNRYYSTLLIDNPANLKNHRVYVYSGTLDTVIRSSVVDKNIEFFKNFMSESRIKSVMNIASNHAMITERFGGACSSINTNYINNCNYDQAFDILEHLYPNDSIQKPSKGATLTGTFIEFDQTEFFPLLSSGTISMDSTGYLYVPKNCLTKTCKLHVALHGCLQGKYVIGDVYIKNSGYNEVADVNDIIILYPQAKNILFTNPNGCWDWWGYSDFNFSNKYGKQMQAINSMITRLAY